MTASLSASERVNMFKVLEINSRLSKARDRLKGLLTVIFQACIEMKSLPSLGTIMKGTYEEKLAFFRGITDIVKSMGVKVGGLSNENMALLEAETVMALQQLMTKARQLYLDDFKLDTNDKESLFLPEEHRDLTKREEKLVKLIDDWVSIVEVAKGIKVDEGLFKALKV